MEEKKAAISAVLVLLSLVVTGAHADLTSEIDDINGLFTEAFNRQDVEAASQLFTEDCIIMQTGSDSLYGRENLKMLLNNFVQIGAASVVIKIDEVGPPDATDTLYERTRYTFFDRDGNIIEKGKAVVVWKKVTGEWRYHILIYNSLPAKKSGDAINEEISALIKQYMEVWENQDAEGVASLYTCNAKAMPPGMDVVHGKEAITETVKMFFNMGVARIHIDEKMEIATMGASEESLYMRGLYTFSSDKGDVIDSGKYLAVVKRVDGQWKIYMIIFNTNSSPPESHDEL